MPNSVLSAASPEPRCSAIIAIFRHKCAFWNIYFFTDGNFWQKPVPIGAELIVTQFPVPPDAAVMLISSNLSAVIGPARWQFALIMS